MIWTLISVAILGALAPGSAPDLSGKWRFTMDSDFRGNRAVVECTIKQQRGSLTVKCGDAGNEVCDEEPKGDLPDAPMSSDRFVATYEAKMNDSGTALEGSWSLKGGALDEKGNFIGKKRH
jgi:hypothetical protein